MDLNVTDPSLHGEDLKNTHKLYRLHVEYCQVLYLLFSLAIAGCLSKVIITSHMRLLWAFCARAPSGFEYD